MKLQYKNLNDQTLAQAFQKLGNTPMSTKVAYNITKIQNKISNEFKTLKEEFVKVLKKYAELDEKGEIKEVAGSGSYRILPANLEVFKKKKKKINSKLF